MRASGGSNHNAADAAHATLSLSDDAVIVVDRYQRVTAVNPAAEVLTGWRTGSAAGTPLGTLLGTGKSYIPIPDGPFVVHARDGRVHATRAYSTALRDASGRPLGSIIVLGANAPHRPERRGEPQLDLAAPEVELAIDALGTGIRERAEEVTALMNMMPVALYLAHDPDCVAVTSNRAADALLAPPDGEMHEGSPYAHRVFHDGAEIGPHEMPIQRAASQGIATDGEEYEIRFDNGTSRYIYGYATPLFGHDARTRGCVAAFVDVTERRRSEDALRESEERFRVLADNVPVMIWVTDRDGKFTYFNQRWREFTGRGLDEDARAQWLETVHPEDQSRVTENFAARFQQREPYSLELRLRHADGDFRWILDTAKPLYRSDGEFAGYIGTCSDITARKLHEQRLEQADRRKDEFLATVAHELRNPLAPIRNALQILSSATTDGEHGRWAREVIERQVAQLVRLVDDLLDVARAACGQLELRLETMTLDSLVHDAVEASRPLIEEGRHQLHITLPGTPVFVRGDRTRLTEIVINLLNNAAKYTPEGGHIRVACDLEGDRAVLRVRDDGIGIAADALARIFQMYAQVESSLDRAQGGLGVGLALARRLAELHGGELTVHSAGLGAGSEFVLQLPAAELPSDRAEPHRNAEPLSGAASLSVLLVDDNPDAAESLGMLLRVHGHEVELAHDGPGALARFPACAPDVVILDIGLPGMNGYEAAEEIRKLPGGSGVMLIALTGWGRSEERARAFAAGFDHHLTKPVSVEDLLELLAAVPQS